MADKCPPAGWSSNELEHVQKCPACHSDQSAFAYEGLRDDLEGVPGEWSMRRCVACGSFYLDVRPSAEAIGKAYVSYHTHTDALVQASEDNGSSLLWRWANGYMRARYGASRAPSSFLGRWVLPLLPPLQQQLDYFYRYLPARPGRLLDVGCGNGVFLTRARAAGWSTQGIEPDPKAVAAAQRAGLDVAEGTLDSCPGLGLFDVVTASHVIEHVHDPLAFLRQIHDRLRPGGQLWLATPNAGSLGHRVFGKAWRGLEPPRHMTVFSLPALRLLLEQAGFAQIKPRHRGRGSRYILQASRDVARNHGITGGYIPPTFVDVLATLSTSHAEECVITAVKVGR
ncbi:class I SAM-dependent methyltransferase [Dyella jiangningensis]|uniref:class I SAM-dependent methyltransferase n=1 Tax=Dyella jiangningensis TaxID=1379159 RepID=UPI00240F1D31|nr:class I SAM-dependent methyltransferase [Dyella jiangningensis]MDG2537164.1 class I SAM-dependent methyltransferase [Dyella jiangningensis]